MDGSEGGGADGGIEPNYEGRAKWKGGEGRLQGKEGGNGGREVGADEMEK